MREESPYLFKMIISYKKETDFLIVRMKGKWTTFDTNRSIDDIKLEAERNAYSKLLFDMEELSVPKNELVRFTSGIKIAETLSTYKIACFSQPEKINNFGEIAATNRGANLKTFACETDATQWLMED